MLLCMTVYSVQAFAIEIEWDVPPTEYVEPAEESEQDMTTVPETEMETETDANIETEQEDAPIYGEPPEIADGGDLTAGTGFRPFTPPGTATVIDNATGADGKEFYTITTEDKNVFYLIIDRQRNSENVYFLNAVTEDDLMALAEKDGKKTTSTATGTKPSPGQAEMPSGEETPPDTPQPPVEKSKTGTYIFLGIAVLGIGGAAYYFKVVKGKKNVPDDEDDGVDDYEDEYDYDGEPDDDDESEEGGDNE